jgi:hypothetical protein
MTIKMIKVAGGKALKLCVKAYACGGRRFLTIREKGFLL